MVHMRSNPNQESKDQEQKEDNQPKACNHKKLTRKISEPSIESDTTSRNGDNCSTNTCLKTIQEASEIAESEGKNIFEKYLSFSVEKRVIF